jgi:hypothetical protein
VGALYDYLFLWIISLSDPLDNFMGIPFGHSFIIISWVTLSALGEGGLEMVVVRYPKGIVYLTLL